MKLQPAWLRKAIAKKDRLWKECDALTDIMIDGCVSLHLSSLAEHPAYEEREKLYHGALADANRQVDTLERKWNDMTPTEQFVEVYNE